MLAKYSYPAASLNNWWIKCLHDVKNIIVINVSILLVNSLSGNKRWIHARSKEAQWVHNGSQVPGNQRETNWGEKKEIVS